MTLNDVRHYIRVYEHDLDPSMCVRLIDLFNSQEVSQARNGRGMRAGLEQSAWTELNVSRHADAAYRAFFRSRVDTALEKYNKDVGLTLAIPNSPRTSDLIMKKYHAGQDDAFQLHFDAAYHVANRYLVVLWYLNDVDEGGETCFPQLETQVKPRAGRLLVFPPYWMYQHEALPPISGDKYIISTYLLFVDPRARG